MALQFQHVFAGKGVGAGKVQGQALIQHLFGIGEEGTVMGIAGFQLALANRQGQLPGQGARNPYYADTTTALGGSDGGNGFTDC
ncbi:hypothetical protein D9M68_983840 [compost metagenome]